MSNKIKLTLLLAFSLAAVLFIPALYGDDWNKATKVTVNQPFEVPGMVLPAGTYIFKIVDLPAEHHVVRISNEDETAVYATLIAFPDWRLETTDDTVVTFYEAEKGRFPALHRWFYPGHKGGVEFAYPEKPVMEFATVAEEPAVPTAPPEPLPVFREKPRPEPVVEEVIPETPIEAEPALEPVTPTVEAAPEPEPEPVPLPKTGTPFPLIGLIGLLSGITASGLRLIRK